MGILTALFQKPAEQRTYPPQWLVDWWDASPVTSGVKVSETTAFKYVAFYSAVDFISRGLGQLPLKLYKRVSDDERQEATSHRQYQMAHTRPNPEQTAFIFRSTMQSWCLRWGNAYAEIQRKNGLPEALWHLRSDRVTARRNKVGKIVYDVFSDAGVVDRTLSAENMLHIRTMGDGMVGYSPVRLFRESIGLGLATEKHGAAFFGNNASPGGLLEHPARLSDKALANLKASWKGVHGGPENAFKPAILQEGMTWKQTAIPNEDAEFLKTRTFQIGDVARMFHVPPHKLSELARATFSNIEHQAIECVQDCYDPWLVNWEQECDFKLLRPVEQKKYYHEFTTAALLRGDTKSRFTAYGQAIKDGWMTRNEVRKKENMNPLEGLDEPLVPMNMAGASEEPPAEEPPEEPSKETDESKALKIHRALLWDRCGHIVRKEVAAMQKIARTGGNGDVEHFYSEHRNHVFRVLQPAVSSIRMSLRSQYSIPELLAFAQQHAQSGRDYFLANGSPDRYEQDRPSEMADQLLEDLRNANPDTE